MTVGVASGRIVVHASGRVSSASHAYARDKVARVARSAPRPVVFIRVDLVVAPDPARERPALAKAEIDMGGSVVRAHATGTTVREAVDRLENRLRERVERTRDRLRSDRLRHRGSDEWRRGDAPTPRASYFRRPADEREIVRRKTFALGAMTPEEAADDLEVLDHDFFLFENAETGEDNVVHRVGDDRYELLTPTPGATAGASVANALARSVEVSARPVARMALEQAVALLDLGEEPFVFSVDEITGRGQVVYRRYDGHYGLVTPATSGEPSTP